MEAHGVVSATGPLIAFITSVSSPSQITLSATTAATANGLTGCYGTDDAVGFSNAIAHARFPTATIVIPSGELSYRSP